MRAGRGGSFGGGAGAFQAKLDGWFRSGFDRRSGRRGTCLGFFDAFFGREVKGRDGGGLGGGRRRWWWRGRRGWGF